MMSVFFLSTFLSSRCIQYLPSATGSRALIEWHCGYTDRVWRLQVVAEVGSIIQCCQWVEFIDTWDVTFIERASLDRCVCVCVCLVCTCAVYVRTCTYMHVCV